MEIINITIVFFLLTFNVSCLNLNYLDPEKLQTITPVEAQKHEALLIIRKYSDKVTVKVDHNLFTNNKDTFHLKTIDGKLHISASSGVSAVWGFHYYLKKYCNSHIGWQVSRIAIPESLPEVNETVVASDRFRYYQNVCTYSYSFVWWNRKQWADHVEWMAMNGINLALAPIDQEAVWREIYTEIGMTQRDIDKHFTGPAFLAWLRMGNIHGWGGPLLPSWHYLQKSIESSITEQMLNLGMIPILPSFNGHVPKAFSRIYPNTTFKQVSKWNNFESKYCCGLFLSPLQPLFQTIGKLFLEKITTKVTTAHIYSADPFNEISVNDISVKEIIETAKAMYSVMTEVDPRAVWLVQNWMFVNMPWFWGKKYARAFLLAIPNGRILILDLEAEHRPQYRRYPMYYGQPFIWCMLHNFGGTSGMIGKIPTINENVYLARYAANSTMIGIGLSPEGINQNYVVYDFMLETGWRQSSVHSLKNWVKDYAERRYGCKSTGPAWTSLLKGVYNYEKNSDNYGHNYSILTLIPSLENKPEHWFTNESIDKAWKYMAFAPSSCRSTGYYHDVVDVTRQALQFRAEQIYEHYLCNKSLEVTKFYISKHYFLEALNDIQNILACNDDFTIRPWLIGARRLAMNYEELSHYELNARYQITLWGPNGEIADYASKQWAELFHYYYIPRWRRFLAAALDAKVKNVTFDEDEVQRQIREEIDKKFETIEISWLHKDDTVKLSKMLFQKWKKISLVSHV